MFRHPKYYTELRKRNKLDQSISLSPGDGQVERSTGPGPKQQATSYKLPGPRPISNANKGLIHKRQASSTKLLKQQAASLKPQAASFKLQAASDKLLDT
jgi:hypothetical protein